MRMPRVFHPRPLHSGTSIELEPAASKHVARVLRLQAGGQLTLFNGDGNEYPARITAAHRDCVEVCIGQPRPGRAESPLAVILLQGVCRGQRMDLVIQKATELGVAMILPVACERSVVRVRGERANRRLEHWQGIAISAAEQSGRTRVPTIGAAQPLTDTLDALKPEGGRLLLDPEATTGLGDAATSDTIVLLCGPEGGLTDAERSQATAEGFQPVRIGPRILRTETAPVAALSILQYRFGDLDRPADER